MLAAGQGKIIFSFDVFYQKSIEKENIIFTLKNQVEKHDMDMNYYNILEKQNEDLRIYAHDTKNHLNAI